MAYKTKNPIYKEKSKRINKLWSLVINSELSKKEYHEEVQNMLNLYFGYSELVEKTGKWKLKGDDKYSLDAKEVADKVINK